MAARTLIGFFVAIAIMCSGCGFIREEPELEDTRWPNGTYQAQVEWLAVEMDLTFDEGDVSGTGSITRSPMDGVWENDELSVDLTVNERAGVGGTWQADWGSGSANGIQSYPLLGLRLRNEAGEEVATLRGSIQESELVFHATLIRAEGDTTEVAMPHRGPLPAASVEISGTLEAEDVVQLFVGPSFQFSGWLTEESLDGSMEFPGVDRLRITLYRQNP